MSGAVIRKRGAISRWAMPAAIALILVAMVLPFWPSTRPVARAMVFFDVSQSMDVQDYQIAGRPASRIEYARASLARAVGQLPCGSEIGLGAFTQTRSLILLLPVEVCANYADLMAAVDSINGRMRWANASHVSKGVVNAWRAMVTPDAKGQPQAGDARLIFVSDGHESPPDPDDAEIAHEGLRIGDMHGWLVGAGGSVARPIPRSYLDGTDGGYWAPNEVAQFTDQDRQQGRASADASDGEHLSRLHEKRLQFVAEQLQFGYRRLDGLDTMPKLLRDPGMGAPGKVHVDIRWIPAALALALLLWAWRPGRLKVVHRH